MEVKNIGSNMTEVRTSKAIVLISYSTPVAAQVFNHDGSSKFIKTNKKWSVTTSRHINKWLDGKSAEEVNQDVLSDILE